MGSLFYGPRVPEEKLARTEVLIEFSNDQPALKEYLGYLLWRRPEIEDTDVGIARSSIQTLVAECADRYIQINRGFDIQDQLLKRVVVPVLNGIWRSSLDVAFVVPIAQLKFDLSRKKITDSTYLIRMSKPFQLSRTQVQYYGAGAHASVIGAATHALVFTEWSLPENRNKFDTIKRISSLGSFPIEKFDRFFAALRIITRADTGYAQKISYPRKWALSYYAGLPVVYGATVRNYPSPFDDYGWLRQVQEIDKEQLQDVSRLFRLAVNSDHPQISIAIKRLNTS